MGLRFGKSYKVAPGVKVNLNKKSTSVTFGDKGVHRTVSSNGKKTTSVGIPGTGMYYTSSSGGGTSSTSDESMKISDSSHEAPKTKDIHEALSKFSNKALKTYRTSFLVFAIIFTALALMCIMHKEIFITLLFLIGAVLSFGGVKTYSKELTYRSQSSDNDFPDLSEKIYENTDFEEVKPSGTDGKPPKKRPRGCGCLAIIVLLIIIFVGIESCSNSSDSESDKKDTKKVEEKASLEGLTISADTSTVYDINTAIPIELSITPTDASVDDLTCESSGGTFTKDGQTLTFSASADGMYILSVSSGDIKSNEITIEVEDKTAKAEREAEAQAAAEAQQQSEVQTQQAVQQPQTSSYVVNTSTGKFHKPSCRDVSKIASENYWAYDGTRDDLINQGYSPCGHCNP